MKRGIIYFFVLMFLCFNVLMISCVYHPIEMPNEPEPKDKIFLPDFPKIEFIPIQLSVNANDLDGHYNVKTENTEILGKDESYEFKSYETHGTVYKNVDFRSFDNKSGVLMFGYSGVFCWIDPSVEIDKDGNFETTIEPRPQWLFGGYFGCKLQITGKLADNRLEAKAIETIYAGIDPKKLEPIGIYKYTLSGYKRYEPKTTPAKTIEGEYKTITTRFTNSCTFQNLPNGDYFFTITDIPQGKGLINTNIENILFTYNVTVAHEGKINHTDQSGNNQNILVGTIDSEKIDLNVGLVYGDIGCSERYEMHGEKRFEEADNNDITIDGIYSVLMTMEENTCTTETYHKRRHLDVRKNDGNKFSLTIGQLEFHPTIDIAENFLESIIDDWMGEGYTIQGTIAPNKLTAQILITLKYYKCHYLYRIEGKKLYKHN